MDRSPPPRHLADLARLAVGARVQDALLVLDVEHRESARGRFTLLTLGNSGGRLPTAPFWAEDQRRIAGSIAGAARSGVRGSVAPSTSAFTDADLGGLLRHTCEVAAIADPDNFTGDVLVSAHGPWQLDRRRAYRGSSDCGVNGGG